ncbi:hypothetical protein D8674_008475 [Pyrus ussuriensis x Pyrus communis]|uniref:Uncharacterized protein n=1 Tax=Pyrus ussuriensis x Pyrus communis TaxID=2448454 RepID=A0A5N5HSV6_9ROSA|nr:hypothetical protein D8674_008475 [Pyrus ussuriensis x Pyrus communis]
MDRKTLHPLFSHASSTLSLSLLRYLPRLPICRSRWDTYLGNVGMSRLGWRRGLMEVVNQADKIRKENSTSVASNAHGEKYRKPKPTNLKPFRFRTDRMFKEATLEEKAHAPLKEITLVMTAGAKSTSKHQNVIQVYLGATSALCVV